jgi:hypothetical protein
LIAPAADSAYSAALFPTRSAIVIIEMIAVFPIGFVFSKMRGAQSPPLHQQSPTAERTFAIVKQPNEIGP